MRFGILFFFWFYSILAVSQMLPCGTIENSDHLKRTRQLVEIQNFNEGQLGYNSIPVALHFIHQTDSTSSYVSGMEEDILDQLNMQFDSARIQFYSCGQPRQLYSDEFYDYDLSEFTDLLWYSFSQERLNIYLMGSIGGGGLCGVFQGNHSVMIAYPCAGEASTISHEIGHYLGLLHTFGTTSRTKELADGSNCTTQGDLICDTPADPNRLELVNSNCIYHGTVEDSLGYPDTVRDANGDPYDPDVYNIMSYYGPFGCRNRFSRQQGDIMNAQIDAYLNTYYSCSGLNANFSVEQIESTCTALTVHFSAEIQDSELQYYWDIDDDGQVDYTTYTLDHTYFEPGKYTVSLEVYDPIGNQSIYRTRYHIVQLSGTSVEAPHVSDFTDGIDTDFIELHQSGLYGWQSFRLVDENMVAYAIIERGAPDDLIFHVDCDQMQHPVLDFRYAYRNGQQPGDTLEIAIDDCENGFVTVWKKWGDNLQTMTNEGHPIHPGEWDSITIELSDFISEHVRIRFRTKGDESYYVPIFIDDVSIIEAPYSSVSHTTVLSDELILYPNPVQDKLFLDVGAASMPYSIFDAQGREQQSGNAYQLIDVTGLNGGVYTLVIRTTDGPALRKRFVKLR